MSDQTKHRLKVEMWPIDRPQPYAGNARTHSDDQVAQIAASMVTFGWTNPILVGPDGVVIAGHCRLLAAQLLDHAKVPVIVLGHLTEVERRALVIADNKLAENAGWDAGKLQAAIQELEADDFDLEILGFSDDELEEYLADPDAPSDGLTDEDAVPEVPETPVTVPGDVWLLGNHRLLCGDATVLADVERVLAGGLADMVFTDPPYNVNYGATMKGKPQGKSHRKIANDNLGDGFEQFLRDACVNMLTVTKGGIYVCMSSSELHTLHQAFVQEGGHWSTFVIWAKNSFTMGRADYQRQYEPILYGWKEGSQHFWCGARDQGDIWFVKKPHVNDLHPTMKPVELVDRAVVNSSKSRDTVLDPFGGSGSTLMACEIHGRQARLLELEPKYCDVIVRRYEEFSGKVATLEVDGRTFADVAAERLAVAA